MDLRDEILAEHSKRQTAMIVDWVGDDTARFAELMRLFLGDVYRITQRVGWPLSNCVEKHPELITPYFGKLLKQLERDDVHVAVRRNVVRLLQFVEIPSRYRGRIFDACYNLLADPEQPVAVRCFSMTVAAKIAKHDRALLDEIRLVATEHPQLLTAGMRAIKTSLRRMKRVVVIGSGGSGKSTFSRKLGEVTGLPVVHLDKLYWHPGWVKTPREEWIEIVRREIEKPEWVIDGNFGNTRAMRMAAADTIIMLDLPRWLCMYRILKRTVTYREGARPDMAEGCHERLDPEFILWVWNYPRDGGRRAMDEISQLGDDKRVVILKTQNEIDAFLKDPYAN